MIFGQHMKFLWILEVWTIFKSFLELKFQNAHRAKRWEAAQLASSKPAWPTCTRPGNGAAHRPLGWPTRAAPARHARARAGVCLARSALMERARRAVLPWLAASPQRLNVGKVFTYSLPGHHTPARQCFMGGGVSERHDNKRVEDR
jgi:hypothetical protein